MVKIMKYYEFLNYEQKFIQNKLEELFISYQVQLVGSGYIDLIVSPHLVEVFIKQLSELGVVIIGVSWWCHFTDTSRSELGCPHGLGGPLSTYFDGCFSETEFYYSIEEEEEFERIKNIELGTEVFQINDMIFQYIANEFVKESYYTKCLTPSLCLHVPDEWVRVRFDK